MKGWWLQKIRSFSLIVAEGGIRIAATIVTLILSTSAQAASFQGLGFLPGGSFESRAYGVSADGHVVVGVGTSSNGTEAFRWTPETGMVGLGDLPGGTFSSAARGVSAEGAVIVGTGSSSQGAEAFRWTPETGMVGLGDLPGGNFYSKANAVSADGKVIVGESSSDKGTIEAFRWTEANGMVGLGHLPTPVNEQQKYLKSQAFGVSSEGSTIVGISTSQFEHYPGDPFRWTAEEGMTQLSGSFTETAARDISANGSVIVGGGECEYCTSGGGPAWQWTAQSGFFQLGKLATGPTGGESIAFGVSADGSIIVGDYFSYELGTVFIWDPIHGMRDLRTLLVAAGIDLTGWDLDTGFAGARDVSADGLTVVGFGHNPAGLTEAWIARLDPSPDCSKAKPSIALLWPPNHRFVPIRILGVIAPQGDPVTIRVDSIRQDEAVNATGNSHTVPDGQGIGTPTAQVRAERGGDPRVPDNGRVYHIGFTATDSQGGSCKGEVLVGVHHDQGKGAIPIDDGANYDSTALSP